MDIICIGEDRKLHICKPDSDKTKCGKKIISKKPTDKDKQTLYSCYECTY